MSRHVMFAVAMIIMVLVAGFIFYLLSSQPETVQGWGAVIVVAVFTLAAAMLYKWYYGHLADEEEILARFRVR